MPQTFYDTELPDALFEAAACSPDLRYDTIVVDEGQDFRQAWWEVVECLLADAGRSEFYVFYDGNQRIYGREAPLLRAMTPVPLTKNLRNTKPVFDLAKRFYDGQNYTSAGPDGVPVELVRADTPGDVGRAVSKILHRVVHELEHPTSDICILSSRSVNACSLGGQKQLGAFRLTSDHNDPTDAVLLETIQRFKGLERPVVVLIDMDKALQDKELLYVGLSRARLVLFLVGSPTILEGLEQVPEGA